MRECGSQPIPCSSSSSQEMQLAFLRLEGSLLRMAQSMLRASTNVMRRTSWHMQCGGVYQCIVRHLLFVGKGSTDFLPRTALGDGIIVANLVSLDHVLAGNYRPLTAQLVTF